MHTILFLWNTLGCSSNPMQLALEPESGAMNVMHWFTSSDMNSWEYKGPIAWGITSLGVHQLPDNNLAITCIQEVRPPTWYEQRNPKVYGYIFDGAFFTPTSWEIDDTETKSYIDPQWFEGKMWYISPTGYTGDPANAPATPIRSENPGTTHYAAPKISDPTIVRYQDEVHVFATQNGSLLHLTGTPLKKIVDAESTKQFNGSTVPFAFVVEDNLYLLSQRQMNGKRYPMISKSTGKNRWSPWKPITELPESISACTSPVIGANPLGGWVMMCIEEKRK